MDTPGSEDVADGLDAFAALLLRHLSDHRDLSFTAAATLGELERTSPARLTALAVAQGITQPSMTQLVQRLEKQGLTTRISDPGDGRVALIAITDAGRELLAERRRARRRRLAELLATLPAEEEQTLAAAMRAALPIAQQLIRKATGTDIGNTSAVS